METITQTNRTILFAEMNPERLNLVTLIGDVRGKNSLDDDKIKEINEELVVSSFEAQGVANVDFKFSNVLDMISPKKIMEDIRQVRREIQYTYGKYMELDEGDPKRLDLGDKLNYQFEQASQNYNNVLAMLPLAIEDIKTRLLLGDGETKQGGQDFKAGLLSMGTEDS